MADHAPPAPDLPAPAVEIDAEAMMRDGKILRADVYRPPGDGPWPVLLARCPYDKQDPGILARLDPPRAARRGYLVVVQDTRGRYGSQGTWEPLVREYDDGYDTVRWAARLPGCDGRVAMYGPGYLGHTQWAALAGQPPELVAAVPEFTWADPYDGLVARGGARELGLLTPWTLSLGIDVLHRRHAERPEELRRRLDRLAEAVAALRDRTYWELPTADLPTLRELRLPAPGRPGGPRLRRVARDHAGLAAATLTVAGWYDAFLQGGLDNHTAARAAGHPAELIVGPWSHEDQTGRLGGTDFGPAVGEPPLGRALDWLDRQLGPGAGRGAGRGGHGEPPVRVFLTGADAWRGLDRWPPEAVDTAWYLHPGGGLSTTAPAEGAPRTFRHDPADPVPTHGGPLLMTGDFPAGPLDQSPVEARQDVLVYTSEPLTSPLTVLGRVRAVVAGSSTAPGADWVVRLCDVGPDGVSRNLTDGILRLDRPTPVPEEHRVDLWSTGHVFLPGHRIRVQVTSSCFPRWDRNPAALAAVAAHTVHHGPPHPSRIVLPRA